MLTQILLFLLQTFFFVLIAAALLRAWMNSIRLKMTGQPGQLVMALTDWLVKPLRRTLPKSWLQSRLDLASLMVAGVLALIFALLWSLVFGVLLGAPDILAFAPQAWFPMLVLALKMLIRVALQLVFVVVLGYALMSWVQPGSAVYGVLASLAEPLLKRLRRFISPIGGVDLSALVLLLLLQVCLMVVG